MEALKNAIKEIKEATEFKKRKIENGKCSNNEMPWKVILYKNKNYFLF